jgi:hypothetical protein
MSRRDEKEHYLQTLAQKLSIECDLPLPVARKHVEQVSIVANIEREQLIVRNTFSAARFG